MIPLRDRKALWGTGAMEKDACRGRRSSPGALGFHRETRGITERNKASRPPAATLQTAESRVRPPPGRWGFSALLRLAEECDEVVAELLEAVFRHRDASINDALELRRSVRIELPRRRIGQEIRQ